VRECRSFSDEQLCSAQRYNRVRLLSGPIEFERDLAWQHLPDVPPHKMVDALLRALPLDMAGEVIEDVSRGAGARQCPISKEAYVAPHILNLNGITYSLEAISRAITDTLCVGKPLVLEHGTVAPHDLHRLRLYPNLSLANTAAFEHGIRFTAHSSVVIPRPDVARATARNVPEVSARIVARQSSSQAVFDKYHECWSQFITSLYGTIYRPHRPEQPLQCLADQRATFCDLVLDGVVFGRHSLKRLVHWDNVVFRRCLLVFATGSPLSMTFTSCRFEDCTLYFSGSAGAIEQGVGATLAGCEIAGCSYVINDEGYTLWTERSLHRHLLQANGAIDADVVRRVVAANTLQSFTKQTGHMAAADAGQWLLKRSKYG
jgi:hypothetical protein